MKKYIEIDKLSKGEELPQKTFEPVTRVQLVRYAGASGDFNPLHTDDTAAQKVGLKGVIAHGPLVMGFMGQAIAQWYPIKNLVRFGVRFKGMTIPGDTITIKAEVTEKIDKKTIICNLTAVNQDGNVKLTGQCEWSI